MRKIIQLAVTSTPGDYPQTIVALCDDGTVFTKDFCKLMQKFDNWEKVQEIPQDNVDVLNKTDITYKKLDNILDGLVEEALKQEGF